jgi:hypothetical protein
MSQERGLKTGQTCIYRDTPSNTVVGQKSGAPDAPTHRHQMHSAAFGAPDLATCLARSKFNGRFSEHRTCPTPSTQCSTPSVRCTPVASRDVFRSSNMSDGGSTDATMSGAHEGLKRLLTSQSHRTLYSVASDAPMTTLSARASVVKTLDVDVSVRRCRSQRPTSVSLP